MTATQVTGMALHPGKVRKPSRNAIRGCSTSVIYGGNVQGKTRSNRLTFRATFPESCQLVLTRCRTSTAVLTQGYILRQDGNDDPRIVCFYSSCPPRKWLLL